MKFRRTLRLSLGALLEHRTRTLLAISGVGAGVAAMVGASALGEGARQDVAASIARMGTNLLIVKPLPVRRSVARKTVNGFAPALKLDDAQAMLALSSVGRAAPAIDGRARVKVGRTAVVTTIRGTTPDFPVVRQFQVARGRFFDDGDDRAALRVAVLGDRVSALVFQGRNAVGQQVRIRGVPFEVIGVLAAKGATLDGADEDNQVLVPIRTALRRVFNARFLSAVYVSVEEPGAMEKADAEIRGLLRARAGRGSPPEVDDFAIQDTTRVRTTQQDMTAGLSRFALWLSTAALLVGGVGILGLMLLSVRERTTEIGLRMAVGARPGDVLVQFLGEASVLAVAGWLIGVALAVAGAAGISYAATWRLGIPVADVLRSLALALGIGLAFGAFPAWTASRIPPIRALVSA